MLKYEIDRFKTPYLSIIDINKKDGFLILETKNGPIKIDADNLNLDEISSFIKELMIPNKLNSEKFLNSPAYIFDMLKDLDDLGIIRDYDLTIKFKSIKDFFEKINKSITSLRELLNDKIKNDLIYLNELIQNECRTNFQSIYDQERFSIISAILHINYLNKFAFLSYKSLSYIIRSVLENSNTKNLKNEIIDLLSSNIYSTVDCFNHIDCFISIIKCIAENDDHFIMPKHQISNDSISGNNLMLDVEQYIIYCLNAVGENKIINDFKESSDISLSIAQNWYLNQYFMTKKYIETITPALSLSINNEIKKYLYQYYNEEIGHEKYEYKNCLSLGLSEEIISNSIPIPFYTLFMDILSYISSTNFIGYITAICLTEGLNDNNQSVSNMFFNTPSIGNLLRTVGNDHDELNEEYNHRNIPRFLSSFIDVVSSNEKKQVFNYIRILLEISYRANDALYNISISKK